MFVDSRTYVCRLKIQGLMFVDQRFKVLCLWVTDSRSYVCGSKIQGLMFVDQTFKGNCDFSYNLPSLANFMY